MVPGFEQELGVEWLPGLHDGLRFGGAETERQRRDLFPFRCCDGERWVGCECLMVRVMEERHVEADIPVIGR